MSDTDSFIDEVTEEVRRDELFGYVRKYGWIALALVLLLVGGAAYNEYSKAQTTAAAQDAGDQLMAALSNDEPAARAEALSQIRLDGSAAAIAALTTASAQQDAGDTDAARATLNSLSLNADVPDIYRDVAAFKAAMLPSDDVAGRRAALDALSAPGAPFALLAQEQIALVQVETGETEAALETLAAIVANAETTRGLRERAQTMIVALGGELETADETQ